MATTVPSKAVLTAPGPAPTAKPELEAMKKVFADTEPAMRQREPLTLQPESIAAAPEGSVDDFVDFSKEPNDGAASQSQLDELIDFEAPTGGADPTIAEIGKAGAQITGGAVLQAVPALKSAAAAIKFTNKLIPTPKNIPGLAAKGTALVVAGGTGLLVGGLFGGGVVDLANSQVERFRDILEQTGLPIPDKVFVKDINELRPKLRPYGVFFEDLAMGLSTTRMTMLAVQKGFKFPESFVGDFLNKALRRFKTNPVAAGSAEMLATLQSAIFGAQAEVVAPGDPLIRAGAEFVGGMASSLEGMIVRPALNRAKDFLARNLSETGRTSQVARVLVDAFEGAGGDVKTLIDDIADGDGLNIPGVNFTPAQVTGNIQLAEIQAALDATDPIFSGEMREQTRQALRAMSRVLTALKGVGDPAALEEAALLRQAMVTARIKSLEKAAEDKMRAAAVGLSADNPQDLAKFSAETTEILGDTLTVGRQIEHGFHEAVRDGVIPVNGYDKFLAAFDSAKGIFPPQVAINKTIKKAIKDVRRGKKILAKMQAGTSKATKAEKKAAVKQFTIKAQIKLRSLFLKMGRISSRANDVEKAADESMLFELAEGIFEDLEAVGASAGRNALPGVSTPLDDALRFTRELHETFTNTLAGRLGDVDIKGKTIYAPESLLRLATRTGSEMTDLNFKQIEEASRFLVDRLDGVSLDGLQFDTVMKLQERVLRLIAAEAVERDPIDPSIITGVSAEALQKMKIKYAAVLERFPAARQVVESAIAGEGGNRAMIAMVEGKRVELAESAAGKIFDVGSAAKYVAKIFSGPVPVERFREAATLARTTSREAEDGLRSAAFQSAIDASTNRATGKVEAPVLVATLVESLGGGDPSMVRILVQNDMLTQAEAGLIDQFTARTRNIIQTATATPTGQVLEPAEVALIDNIIRGVGSLGGVELLSHISAVVGIKGGAGPSLIAAKGGSKASVAFFKALGSTKMRTILEGALRGDPVPGGKRFSLLAMLLETGLEPRRLESSLLLVNAYLLSIGVRTAQIGQGEKEP